MQSVWIKPRSLSLRKRHPLSALDLPGSFFAELEYDFFLYGC